MLFIFVKKKKYLVFNKIIVSFLALTHSYRQNYTPRRKRQKLKLGEEKPESNFDQKSWCDSKSTKKSTRRT